MDYQGQQQYKRQLQKCQKLMDNQEADYERKRDVIPNYVETYDEKLVISGFHIVHSQYEKPIWRGFNRNEASIEQGAVKRKVSTEIRKELDEEIQEYTRQFPQATKDDKTALKELKRIKDKYTDALKIREDNEKRKIRTLKNKIQANFDEWTHFITLSYEQNIMDIVKTKEHLKYWIDKKMKKLYPDFLYVYVMEFQQRGAIHFHIVCRMDKGKRVPPEKFKETAKTWKHGSIDIRGIRYKYIPKKHVNEAETELKELSMSKRMATIWSVGNYLTSYLKKGADDVLLFGSKMYGSSSGLKDEIVIRDKKRIATILSELGVERLKEKTYEIKQTETDNTITMKCYNQLITK